MQEVFTRSVRGRRLVTFPERAGFTVIPDDGERRLPGGAAPESPAAGHGVGADGLVLALATALIRWPWSPGRTRW
jgi:hypothetical protein